MADLGEVRRTLLARLGQRELAAVERLAAQAAEELWRAGQARGLTPSVWAFALPALERQVATRLARYFRED